MRKANALGMNSVSLSCLIEEPSSKSERELFINAFLTTLKQAICPKGPCHIAHLRLVQEEKDTIGEFSDFFKTYYDQLMQLNLDENSANTSMINNSMHDSNTSQPAENTTP